MRAQPASAVTGVVNYLRPIGELIYHYNLVDPPEGKPATNEVLDPREVEIRSLRDGERSRLDVQGFELVPFSPTIDDIYDPAQMQAQYYPQVVELVKRHTGAIQVHVFTPFLRGPEAQRRMPGSITFYAGSAHVDFTEETGPQTFDRLLGGAASELRGRRFALINVWRLITGPTPDHPLAMCDARTVDAADLLLTRNYSRADERGLRTPHGKITSGEIYQVGFNPRHRWYYVPDMLPSEALLLKNYDSRRDGVSRFSPHCAFVDPGAPADAPPRASIEVRTLAIW